MNAQEAQLLRQDKRVLHIEPNIISHTQGYETNMGWGLDRINSQTPYLDNIYTWNATGSGRTIYVLDSGVNTSLPEFGGRAVTFYDFTGGSGQDCNGHGTAVASAAGGNSFGVAKGVSIISLKITDVNPGDHCTGSSNAATLITSFDWLAANAPAGTIVNVSSGFSNITGCAPITNSALDASIQNAFAHGIIIVVAAGNDGCNTANFAMTDIDQDFVVGATSNSGIPYGLDTKSTFSRTGLQIDLFAPGENIYVYSTDGSIWNYSGRSFSAPYVSGLFAIGCQLYPTYCTNVQTAFDGLKAAMVYNTVVNPDRSPLTGATSRMIYQAW
jgi:serine protease